jgi:tRNA A37 threonylcarbamoyladenosine dehydratase
MAKKKILIIGVGGIGSYLTPLLSKTDNYDITIADPDVVEEKNVSY